LTRCPWCQLEEHGIVYFLTLDVSVLPGAGFVLVRVWAAIEAVQPPSPVPLRDYDQVAVQPTPLPADLMSRGGLRAAAFVIFGLVIAMAVAIPRYWFFFAAAGWGLWKALERPAARRSERLRRQTEHSDAQKAYQSLLAQRQDDGSFETKKRQLVAARD